MCYITISKLTISRCTEYRFDHPFKFRVEFRSVIQSSLSVLQFAFPGRIHLKLANAKLSRLSRLTAVLFHHLAQYLLDRWLMKLICTIISTIIPCSIRQCFGVLFLFVAMAQAEAEPRPEGCRPSQVWSSQACLASPCHADRAAHRGSAVGHERLLHIRACRTLRSPSAAVVVLTFPVPSNTHLTLPSSHRWQGIMGTQYPRV